MYLYILAFIYLYANRIEHHISTAAWRRVLKHGVWRSVLVSVRERVRVATVYTWVTRSSLWPRLRALKRDRRLRDAVMVKNPNCQDDTVAKIILTVSQTELALCGSHV